MSVRRERLGGQANPDLREKIPLEEEEDEGEEEEEEEGSERAEGARVTKQPTSKSGGADGREASPPKYVDLLESLALEPRNVDLVSSQDLNADMPDELYPPKNFAMVEKGIYRSAYPTKKNFDFLAKLGLKSVVYLCQEEYSRQVLQFYRQEGITVYQHGVSGNKEPFVDISDEMIYSALQRLLDVSFHPILIHCNQGKHRTGSLVGCLRAMNHWSMAAIFDEYRRFAGNKARRADQQFIELFHRKFPKVKTDPRQHPVWFLG
ncbi:hypothetical protein GUITHDRAFT_156243 [Guillardia theta CCMP2712]|uniref:diphosphoinositol-polyphosphate diphosphatase n=2 Tax=Guillardia theta TaxID=55529 RepID=L1I9H3_GUITC|nr:hypothetical protein GUITHDRAFT_156243 [Guillardia theta CCMP2712]EKX32747.1 hypothetical protein GUITHDRAFT_156243 [Guillardia theta CCMP2712]|eukprot:XP_005819727.1 hypothetical protein GUITHDRAFT_156243 [Guillardia theta CCMP2712]